MNISADTLLGLLNPIDLILLALLLVSLIIGLRRGCIRTLCGLLGKIAAMAAAVFLARALAPALARYLVTPIIGDIFEKRASQFQLYTAVLDGLRETVTEAAINMAESIAFLALLLLFFLLFSLIASLLIHLLRSLSQRTLLGVADSLGGGLLGVFGGLLLICIALLVIEWVAPITYSSLGFLSPARVDSTVLLRFLIDHLPVAI